ncbi:hypothetical protein [Variovorax paradoxus]|uniref:hypothetical protein n=1 Tax=Variovorax paradoxus TaxID=34073 RepID=UPI00209D314F|nr:hypothetical protein [Variovorax paradoxus]
MKPPRAPARMLRRATLATAMLGGVLAAATNAAAQTAPMPAQAGMPGATPGDIVTALKAVAGDPPNVRATFAKGQCVRGTYTPARDAARVTRSPSFNRPSAVVARFSVGGGNPKVADNNKAVLRGWRCGWATRAKAPPWCWRARRCISPAAWTRCWRS